LIYDWHKSGVINYLGKTDDVTAIVRKYSAIVLPAYYGEGVPRSLLEAGALGKPIITSDSAGCRETVVDGVSGFLCEPENLNSLIEKLEQFISLSPENRRKMGRASRKHIEQNFSEETLINAYF
jgi:glycosyltransferase involved in cell wall biosynthesis